MTDFNDLENEIITALSKGEGSKYWRELWDMTALIHHAFSQAIRTDPVALKEFLDNGVGKFSLSDLLADFSSDTKTYRKQLKLLIDHGATVKQALASIKDEHDRAKADKALEPLRLYQHELIMKKPSSMKLPEKPEKSEKPPKKKPLVTEEEESSSSSSSSEEEEIKVYNLHDLGKLTTDQLKKLSKKRGLTPSPKRATLLDRLIDDQTRQLKKLPVTRLKKMLTTRGISTKGKKSDWVDRLLNGESESSSRGLRKEISSRVRGEAEGEETDNEAEEEARVANKESDDD
jgi:hypothetical protein